MKVLAYSLSIAAIAALTACACSSKTEDDILPVTVRAVPDPSSPNFFELSAEGAGEGATFEWRLPDGSKKTGRTAVCYFDRKGNYDIELVCTEGKASSKTHTTVTVGEDSYYRSNGESLWWSDDFTDPVIDPKAWNYDTGIGQWGNNEWENYTNKPENSFIRDGKLVLKAIRTGEGQKIGDYTSARLTTRGKKEINRGRVEVRAKIPGGVGLWPAIWFFGRKAAPEYSELDIMEYVGCDKNIIYGAVHTSETLADPNKKVSENMTVDDVETAFHVFGMNWTDGKIEYYLDNPSNVYLTFAPDDCSDKRVWPFDSELYLILNIAVGGDWGGMHGVDDSIFPREMEVDYVRIFKKD